MKAGYDLGKERCFVNHLLCMDDLKLYGRNDKQLDTMIYKVRIFRADIRVEFGIDKRGVMVMKRGKSKEK